MDKFKRQYNYKKDYKILEKYIIKEKRIKENITGLVIRALRNDNLDMPRNLPKGFPKSVIDIVKKNLKKMTM